MEAGEVGVLYDVVKAKAHVVRKAGRVSAVNDASFQSCEDLGEVHNNWGCAELLKDQSLHPGRGAELPVFKVFNLGNWLGRGKAFLSVDPPADQLHSVFVVKRCSRFFAATKVQPA